MKSLSLAPRATIINSAESQNRKININVGGETHSPYVSTLKNVPDCPLAWIIRDECRDGLDYDSGSNVYFFDRNPAIFANILNYFQTGKLHCPRDVCGPMFEEELNFWGIDETQMEACCWPNYTAHREIQKNLKYFRIARQKQTNGSSSRIADDEIAKNNQSVSHLNVTGGQSKWKRYQQTMWEVLDEPYSSYLAKIFAYISLGFIVLSIITYSLLTIEEIKYRTIPCKVNSSNNSLDTNITSGMCREETYSVQIFRSLEMLFAIWFTLEIALRFTFCPNKKDFVKTSSNWVDLLAVIPVYLLLILSGGEGLMLLNMVRYVRIFRFFKLLYDLQILGKTLQAGVYQMFILFLILCVPTIILSSIVYYTEYYMGSEKSKKQFNGIQKGIWWAVVTMTTVGYGRVTPDSIPGKMLGTAAAVVGIVFVSITASVIGTSFQQYYNVARTQLSIPAKTETAFKKTTEKDTLYKRLRRENGKPASIKSDDSSKDSGYGRSPLSTGDSDSGNSASWREVENSPPASSLKHRERIIVIEMAETQNEAEAV